MADAFQYPLDDSFESPTGTMRGALPQRHHYDIRAFHTTDQTLTWTQNDQNFWSGYKYGGLTVGNPRSLGQLAGTETWTSGTVGKDSNYRWSNTISQGVTSVTGSGFYGTTAYGTAPYGSSTTTMQSDFVGDLLTNFSDPARTYYIELVLRNFPAQAATPRFDLDNSFIDFSSTTTYDIGTVDSLQFSASINSVTAGGDTYLRFPRTLIRNATLQNLRSVRFRLRAVGGTAQFTAQALRLVDDLYTWNVIDVDTKRQQLTRSVPRAGGTEPSTTFGDVYFPNEQPKDITYLTQFNSGHNPTGNDNVLRHFFRKQSNGDRIEFKLTSRDTQSRLFIIQRQSGVDTTLLSTAINSNILTQETFYFMMSELSGNQARVSIYQRSNLIPGALVYTTGWQTINIITRGLVGYSFEPYMYDFTVQNMAPQSTSFATFQTTAFNSLKPVRGATLYPTSSAPANLILGTTPQATGDATLVVDPSTGYLTLTRAGSATQGGVLYTPAMFLGDTSQVKLTGYLWTSTPQGTYRAALVDYVDEVLWLTSLGTILANQWNYFEISVPAALPAERMYLHIQQSGTYSGSFRLRDVGIQYTSISWYITPDNGTTWIPFNNAINDEFAGVMFASLTKSMKLRATSTTDYGWISGYQLKPQYAY